MNEIIVFTKLFKNKSLSDLIAIGQAYGLDGYDLCVRPGYLVNPDNVLETLLPAVKALSTAGLAVPTRAALTWSGVRLGFFCKSSATAPLTIGAAMLVPLRMK